MQEVHPLPLTRLPIIALMTNAIRAAFDGTREGVAIFEDRFGQLLVS